MSTGEKISFDADLIVQNLTERNLHQRLGDKGLSQRISIEDICDEAESFVEVLNEVAGCKLTPEMVRNQAEVREAIYSLLWKFGQDIMETEFLEDEDDEFKKVRPKYPNLVGKRIVATGIPDSEIDDNSAFVRNIHDLLQNADEREKMFLEVARSPMFFYRVFKLFRSAERRGERVLARNIDQFCQVVFNGKNLVEKVQFVENFMKPEAEEGNAMDLFDAVCKHVFGSVGEKLRMEAYDYFLGKNNEGDSESRKALYEWALALRETNSRLYELFGTALEYLIMTNEPAEA